MERKPYIELCQRASFKTFYARAWWRAKWNPDELAYWEGKPFVPVDYRFGFVKGNETTLPSHKTALNGFGGENHES